MKKGEGRPVDPVKMEAVYAALAGAGFVEVVISSLVLKRKPEIVAEGMGDAPSGLVCHVVDLPDGSYKIICS